MAYVRTVKTSSGSTAVQIVWSSRHGSRSIEHLGSAHDEAELAALKAAAAERLAANQTDVDQALTALKRAAEGTRNTMPLILDAVLAYATVGEICSALKHVFGGYTETSVV